MQDRNLSAPAASVIVALIGLAGIFLKQLLEDRSKARERTRSA